MSKQNIYDNDLFYENFEKIRSKEINFNDIIETPIILGMIPELYKKKVLDIGCGMGQHALQYSKPANKKSSPQEDLTEENLQGEGE